MWLSPCVTTITQNKLRMVQQILEGLEDDVEAAIIN